MSTQLLKSTEALEKAIEAPWGRLTWLANGDIGNVNDLTLGLVVIRKDKQNPRHSHPNCEEVL